MLRELPEGWEWKRLGDVCKKPEYGYTTSAKKGGDGPKFLRTTDITKDKFEWANVPFCEQAPDDEEKYRLHDGDLLISRAGSVGAAFVVQNPPRAVFASYLIRFQPKEDLNPFFADFFLKSNIFKNQLGGATSGTTLQGVNASNLAKIKIPLPPLPVQRQIVAVLEQAEAVKRQRQEADALTDALLQSVFFEMFGDPAKNERGWKIKKMGDLGDWTSGGTPSRVRPEYFEGNIPWYSTGELNDSYLVDSLEHITQEGLDSSAAKIFPIGTILIGMYDSAAFKMGILCHPSATNQACAAFSPRNELIDTFFALQLFKAMKPSFLSRRRGVRQKNLNQQIIKDFEVPLPPIALQQQFARIIQEVERIREQQAESKREIEGLFEGLMQRAFNGESVA